MNLRFIFVLIRVWMWPINQLDKMASNPKQLCSLNVKLDHQIKSFIEIT